MASVDELSAVAFPKSSKSSILNHTQLVYGMSSMGDSSITGSSSSTSRTKVHLLVVIRDEV